MVLRTRGRAYEEPLLPVTADIKEVAELGVAVHLAFGPRRGGRSGVHRGARFRLSAGAVVEGSRGEIRQVRPTPLQPLAWGQLQRTGAVQIDAPDGPVLVSAPIGTEEQRLAVRRGLIQDDAFVQLK